MIGKDSTLTLKPSPRKTRSKIRKPKFLSLRLQLISSAAPPPPPPMPTSTSDHQLINLFPLHPENLVEQDKLEEAEHNMACMFSSCDDDGAATTLTGILCSGDDEDQEENTNNPSPSSVNYADEEGELVRTAMRRNKTERENHHEKWVCYSEVVEKKKVIRGFSNSSLTSSSSSCNHHQGDDDDRNQSRSRSKLVLKLDYEKIMKSWVNKGPLYINNNPDPDPGMHGSQPQTVPELQDDDPFISPFAIGNIKRTDSSNGNLWTVPEMMQIKNNDVIKETGDEEASLVATSNAMINNREASVQRYKEKRRNRLFSKTIRYQVRKLNAEKRPRIKGRFVKRN